MAEDHLSAGQGRCICAARTLLQPSQAVLQTGSAADVFRDMLTAVHQVNRHGPYDDRIAIGFPGLVAARGLLALGREIEAYGSEGALERLLAHDLVMRAARRDMIEMPEIHETWIDERETGTAFIRSRTGEKSTPAGLARAQRRFLKRAEGTDREWVERRHRGARLRRELPFFHASGCRVTFEAVAMPCAAEILVSTYGLSAKGTAMGLPIVLAGADLAAA